MWEYELVFNQDHRSRPVIKKEKLIRFDLSTKKEEWVSLPLEEDKHDPEKLLIQKRINESGEEIKIQIYKRGWASRFFFC